MITRTLLVSSVIAVAGLGLIGVGSNATFTQDTFSSQEITAGTMKVVVYAGDHDPGDATAQAVLPAFGPTNSTFSTGDQLVTIKNSGNIAVDAYVFKPAFTSGSSAASLNLAAHVYVCVASQGQVLYNGPVATAPDQPVTGPIAVGHTDNYTVNYYAGKVTTACGAEKTAGQPALAGESVAPDLTNDAQGGVMTPTIKISYTG